MELVSKNEGCALRKTMASAGAAPWIMYFALYISQRYGAESNSLCSVTSIRYKMYF